MAETSDDGAPDRARLQQQLQRLEGELREARLALSQKAFALGSLVDASQDLAPAAAEASVEELLLTSVMGHFLVSRCALYLLGPHGLAPVKARGLRTAAASLPVTTAEALAELGRLARPAAVAEMPDGALRRRLEADRLTLAVPLPAGGAALGLLALGERASGRPYSDEDREVASTLARQAGTAIENARLQRIREEKQRQDRELQIARQIQESLLPGRPPEIAGFEIAGRSRPCEEVGGDSYDWIPLDGERLALVVADVAGKGTPASLLMASVHASVQVLAGTTEPARLVDRLNRFLCSRSPASRFVTLFYAELDSSTGRLAFVNAGHVPPYRVARDGAVTRLREGGPALGLLPGAAYEVGEAQLAPGDVVAIVTDGVTEAASAEDCEFGDEQVCAVLKQAAPAGAGAILGHLVSAVEAWTGREAFADDLTAVILKASAG